MKATGLAVVILLLVSGCKSTEPLYYHGSYQASVYHYFKHDEVTIDQQINALKITLEQAANAGRPVAPGVHAHLGMLYFEQDDSVNGHLHFTREKALFPESVRYLDFLLANQMGDK